jgi:hypothetical protein
MAISWWNRLLQSKSRPAPRRRPDRVRLAVEGLEARELMTVSANLVNGQLRVFSDNGDTVTLDHAGSFTFVNGQSFADSAITSNIAINAGGFFGPGFNTVNLRATVRSVTVDSPGRLDFLTVGGKPGLGMQGLLAPLNLRGFNGGAFLTFDDSANSSPRFVTLNESAPVATLAGLAPERITFFDTGFGTLTINGGSGGNTFTIFDTPHEGFFHSVDTILNSGTGRDTVTVFGTSSSFFQVEGQNGADQVTLFPQGLLAGATVTNARGRTDLVVDDSADTVGRNVFLGDGFVGGFRGNDRDVIVFAGALSSLYIKGGRGGNTFDIIDTFNRHIFSLTTIDTGLGADTVTVRGTSGNLNIHGQAGQDRVTVGDTEFGFGTGRIHGDVFVSNEFSRTALTVTDEPGTVAHPAVVLDHVPVFGGGNLGTISGLAPANIKYVSNDVNSVTLTGSTRDDSFFVRSTPVSNTTVPVTVNGGAGNDLFVVGSANNTLDGILGPVTINGGLGFDTLIVNDQGAHVGHSYSQSGSQITRSGGGGPTVVINFSSVEDPHLNPNTVTSSPPMVQDLALSRHVRVGEPATLSGRLVDDDEDDVLSLTVDWGDGSEPETSTPDRAPFAVTHRYASPGTYTAHVTWSDDTGLSNSRDLTIRVKPARTAADGSTGAPFGPGLVNGLDAFFALLGAGDGDHHDRHEVGAWVRSAIQPCV